MRITEIVGQPLTDRTGTPLVFYHGTGRQFDTFQKMTAIRPDTSLGGFSFTTDPRSARNYAMSAARISGEKPRLVRVYLVMHNPLDITKLIAKFQKNRTLPFGDAKRLALQSYDPRTSDGFIFRGNGQNPDEYVVFNPAQIIPI